MCRKLFPLLMCAAALTPARVFAGGPPWLTLPIEGATAATAADCAKLLQAKLSDKVSPYLEGPNVRVIERDGQFYLAVDMNKDVRLSDITAALKGSEFSARTDELHLFGHVVLEIKAPAADEKALVAGLEKLGGTSVAESKAEGDAIAITIDMPYPADMNQVKRGNAGFAAFTWNDLASHARKSEKAVTGAGLPSYDAIAKVVSQHGGKLTDLRWSIKYACRPVGGVAVSDEKAKAQPEKLSAAR